MTQISIGLGLGHVKEQERELALVRGRKETIIMIEIRIHGRGGQGAVIASEILATAFFREGQSVQAFPAFGVERRGAPVAAFVRADSAPIRLRCQIYTPDHVIVLDPTLLSVVDVTAGLKPGGIVLINAEHAPATFPALRQFNVATVAAGAIAASHNLGTSTNPIVNTTILGAFVRATGLIELDTLLGAIREKITSDSEKNIASAREAYQHLILASEKVRALDKAVHSLVSS